jgi:hypothetical protein
MSMFIKYLACVSSVFLLASSALVTAAEQGFVEGHMKIIFGMAVGESDEMPRAEGAPQSYAKYPLIVLSQEDKKEIARVPVDQSGNYRVALSPGNYVLDIQDRVAKHIRAAPRPFTVVSNQTVHVDMNILHGIRRVQPAGAGRDD